MQIIGGGFSCDFRRQKKVKIGFAFLICSPYLWRKEQRKWKHPTTLNPYTANWPRYVQNKLDPRILNPRDWLNENRREDGYIYNADGIRVNRWREYFLLCYKRKAAEYVPPVRLIDPTTDARVLRYRARQAAPLKPVPDAVRERLERLKHKNIY